MSAMLRILIKCNEHSVENNLNLATRLSGPLTTLASQVFVEKVINLGDLDSNVVVSLESV